MEKKRKHGRPRHHHSSSTHHAAEPSLTNRDRTIAGELIAALLDAITFGALRGNGANGQKPAHATSGTST